MQNQSDLNHAYQGTQQSGLNTAQWLPPVPDYKKMLGEIDDCVRHAETACNEQNWAMMAMYLGIIGGITATLLRPK